MINNVILTGRFKGFSDNYHLLLKMENLENHKIVKIDISSDLKEKIADFVKEGDIVGIKGYIELDSVHKIIIVATRITFLSTKQKAQD